VVRPGEAVKTLEIEYEPRAVAALFDARLELDTNLTTLQVPLRVYHGQLACFDAAQAATRAAAAAAAASSAYSTVTPARPSPEAGELTDERATRANSSELSRETEIAVPCAVSDGKYREKEGLSIMGVIDFGVTRVGDTKVRRVAVRNPNPVAGRDRVRDQYGARRASDARRGFGGAAQRAHRALLRLRAPVGVRDAKHTAVPPGPAAGGVPDRAREDGGVRAELREARKFSPRRARTAPTRATSSTTSSTRKS
jgi:hypothetical protein